MLVGRARELARVRAALGGHRAVGIVGLPGIGKTALAREIGRRLRGRTRFVSCAAGGGAGALAMSIERALGLRLPAGLAPGTEERGLRIAERLEADGDCLVLDDLHLCADAPKLVGPLVGALDRARLVYASRTRLTLSPREEAEQTVLVLGRLDARSSTALARDALRALGAPSSAARRVARSAAGHPLAIKIAAAAGERKSKRLDALLEVVMEGLSPRARAALVELCAHRRPVPAAIPEELVERFLVERTEEGPRVHDLVRRAVGPPTPEAHRRAARRYGARTPRDLAAARERVHHLLAAGDREAAASCLEDFAIPLTRAGEYVELRRFLAALGGGRRPLSLGTSTRIAQAKLRLHEGRPEEALAILRAIGPVRALSSRAAALAAGATASFLLGDSRAVATSMRAMERIPPAGDAHHHYMSVLLLHLHCLCVARRDAEAFAAVARVERRFGPGHPQAMWARGNVMLFAERPREAVQAYAVTLERGTLSRNQEAIVRARLAEALVSLGQAAAATAEVRAGLERIAPLGRPDLEASLRAKQAAALLSTGRLRSAREAYDRVIPDLARTSRTAHVQARLERAEVAAKQGDLGAAEEDLRIALAVALRQGDRTVVAAAKVGLAEVQCARGRHAQAGRACDEATAGGRPTTLVRAWVVRGRIALAKGDRVRAVSAAKRAIAAAGDRMPLLLRGWTLLGDGDAGRGATEALSRGAEIARACGDLRAEAILLARHGERLIASGEIDRARADLTRSLALCETLGVDAPAGVTAMLRARLEEAGPLAGAPLVLDVARRSVVAMGRRIGLHATPVLWRLLVVLEAAAGRAVPKPEIFRAVWGHRYRPDLHDRNVYDTVRRIRRALGLGDRPVPGRPAILTTPHGYALVGTDGARLAADDSAPSPGREGRLERVLHMAVTSGRVRNADVRRALDVFRTTATEYLESLVAQGRLRRVGRGRGAHYVAVPDPR